ncbi:hypothetical protein C8R46DRAFT_1224045 [Mycena filopes]|nr:hypothetical protein C8R46DRAFT_1224045 [Mycena filopes]
MNLPGDRRPPSPASLRASLAGIDAELAALRARVKELAAARKPIVDALKATVYPILSIPVETTAEIFLQCVDRAEISAQRRILCAPLVLAGVCKQWRAVALNLQPIWSCLQISYVPTSKIPKLERLLEWWLPRAGGRLLEVDMIRGDISLLTALIPHSTRWKSLSCDFHSRPPLAPIQGRLTHLEKLHIQLAWAEVPTEVTTIFSNAPLLREAHIVGFAFGSFILPWGQLTTLALGRDFATTYIEILRNTPQLEILDLERAARQSVPPQTALTLHHLHTLTLNRYGGGEDEDSSLAPLILPALQQLDLGPFPEQFVQEVVGFLIQSGCSLVSISYRASPPHLQSLILKAARTPSEVHLADLDWTPYELYIFFNSLHCNSGILPNLRTLSISSSREVDVQYAPMARMVASRQGSKEGYAQLESFRFTFPRFTPFDDDSEESALFENATLQGCKIDIQGLKGFNIGVHTGSGSAHSYTLENPPHIF